MFWYRIEILVVICMVCFYLHNSEEYLLSIVYGGTSYLLFVVNIGIFGILLKSLDFIHIKDLDHNVNYSSSSSPHLSAQAQPAHTTRTNSELHPDPARRDVVPSSLLFAVPPHLSPNHQHRASPFSSPSSRRPHLRSLGTNTPPNAPRYPCPERLGPRPRLRLRPPWPRGTGFRASSGLIPRARAGCHVDGLHPHARQWCRGLSPCPIDPTSLPRSALRPSGC